MFSLTSKYSFKKVIKLMVDLTGIEPVASYMRSKRSATDLQALFNDINTIKK